LFPAFVFFAGLFLLLFLLRCGFFFLSLLVAACLVVSILLLCGILLAEILLLLLEFAPVFRVENFLVAACLFGRKLFGVARFFKSPFLVPALRVVQLTPVPRFETEVGHVRILCGD